MLLLLLLVALSAGEADARRKGKVGIVEAVKQPAAPTIAERREHRAEKKAVEQGGPPRGQPTATQPAVSGGGLSLLGFFHYALVLLHAGLLVVCVRASKWG